MRSEQRNQSYSYQCCQSHCSHKRLNPLYSQSSSPILMWYRQHYFLKINCMILTRGNGSQVGVRVQRFFIKLNLFMDSFSYAFCSNSCNSNRIQQVLSWCNQGTWQWEVSRPSLENIFSKTSQWRLLLIWESSESSLIPGVIAVFFFEFCHFTSLAETFSRFFHELSNQRMHLSKCCRLFTSST